MSPTSYRAAPPRIVERKYSLSGHPIQGILHELFAIYTVLCGAIDRADSVVLELRNPLCELGFKRACWSRPAYPMDFTSPHKQNQRGKALNIEACRQIRLLVRIHLHDRSFALPVFRQLLKYRVHHTAGSAPFRPKVCQHGFILCCDIVQKL
jgi:hypothetical protein